MPLWGVANVWSSWAENHQYNRPLGLLVGAKVWTREVLRGLTTKSLIVPCALMVPSTVERMMRKELAQRINYLSGGLRGLKKTWTETVTVFAPQLLERSGLGGSAAALNIAVGDYPKMMKGQASFAALYRVRQVEFFSSDKIRKRRL